VSQINWIVCAALIGMMPGVGQAQQAGQPTARLNENNLRDVPDALTAPLPAVVATEQGPITEGQTMTAHGLTLAELENLAQRSNPTLNQAAARVEAARGHCDQVGLYPNPVAGYMGSEIGNSGRAGQQGGFVSQEVVTAGKLQLNQAVAAQEVQQAQWAWDAQRRRVLTDVRRGYFDVLVAQRTVELSEQLVRIGQEGMKTAEALQKAKEVARFDVLQARIEADSAQLLMERAKNRCLGAWRNLATVVGTPEMQATPLGGNLHDGVPQLSWNETWQRILAESPAVGSARAGVARAQAAIRRECAGRVPNVDVQTAVQYDNSTQDTFASVQLGIPIPVFNRNQGNIQRAQAELIAAQENVRRTELALQQRLAVVFEQYTNARFQVDKYTTAILPNAKASLDMVVIGYRQGEFPYLALLTSQRTFFQANLAYVEALKDLRSTAATIEGGLLTDSLQEGR
jgi:outer membrane protein, heavy metal efflux system